MQGRDLEALVGERFVDPAGPLQHQQLSRVGAVTVVSDVAARQVRHVGSVAVQLPQCDGVLHQV